MERLEGMLGLNPQNSDRGIETCSPAGEHAGFGSLNPQNSDQGIETPPPRPAAPRRPLRLNPQNSDQGIETYLPGLCYARLILV